MSVDVHLACGKSPFYLISLKIRAETKFRNMVSIMAQKGWKLNDSNGNNLSIQQYRVVTSPCCVLEQTAVSKHLNHETSRRQQRSQNKRVINMKVIRRINSRLTISRRRVILLFWSQVFVICRFQWTSFAENINKYSRNSSRQQLLK